MPKLSVWFIRASLLYLAAGFTLGALLLFNKGIPIDPWTWRILPAHIEFLLFGFVLQLIFGTAFWILPRFSTGSRRGNETIAWTAFVLLNAGILTASMTALFPGSQAISLLGSTLETAAAVAFAYHAWPRVKSAASRK